jgi:uroporphyrinogen decarboxylase
MNSRERLLTTLNHSEPDRVPFDLGGTETSGISVVALRNWMALNRMPIYRVEVASLATQTGRVPDAVVQRFNIDCRCLQTQPASGFELTFKEKGSTRSYTDEWGITWTMPLPEGHYYDISASPLAACESVEDVARHRWPDAADSSRYSHLEETAETMGSGGKAALIMERDAGGIFETAWWMRGFENMLVDMASDHRMAECILSKVLEYKLVYWENVLSRVKDRVLVAAEADDIATQSGLLLSLDMYRKVLKPLHKELFAAIKKHAPGVKIFFHSCGAVRDLIPDLIEVGVDILNPVQVSAAGMDTRSLKKEFGRDLTFWGGGVDTQRILPLGTPQQVKDEVRRRIDDLAPGGGFVFAAVHCIQKDVPPQNIQAMWEALQEYGVY